MIAMLLLLTSLAWAMPSDFINQDGDTWLLHTFTESSEGYVENIFEITAMRLRCIAQFFNEESKVEVRPIDFSRIVHHQFHVPSVVRREFSAPAVSALTPRTLTRMGLLNQRRQMSQSPVITPPSHPASLVESRRSSGIASTASNADVSTPASEVSIQSINSTNSDNMPDFR